jgi:predicted lipoprotein with Yx(FWY)xxD motif
MKHLISLTPRPKLTGLLILFSLIGAACSSTANADNPADNPPIALPPTGGGTVQVADNPEFGQILMTSDGMTLYTNTVDTPEDLRCTNLACTGFWPPYTVDAQPTADEEIQGSLGTITRPDGSTQLTYNDQPLYTFYLDKQPGEAKGNGFTDLGGTWHVVTLGDLQSSPVESSSDDNSGTGGYQY